MKKIIIVIQIVLFSIVQSYGSSNELLVYLSLDKEKYHANEDVMLKMHIKNISGKKVTFSIYDVSNKGSQSFITFQPVVFNTKGKIAENIVPHIIEGATSEKIVSMAKKREITLAPLEKIVRLVPLNKIYRLEKNMDYKVKGYFFPDYKKTKVITGSNMVTFFIDKKTISAKKTQYDRTKTLGPDEVVLLTLHAEKNKHWNKMIKFLDIPEYINSFSEYVRKYNLANRYEKKNIENEFISYLSRDRFDYIVDFKIKRVKITGDHAIVVAEVERFGLRKSIMYSYKFDLKKTSKAHWLIQGYEATVIRGK